MSAEEVQRKDSIRKVLWVGKWLLQVPAYLVTNYAVRWLISTGYRKFAGEGSFPGSFFVRHPLDFSLIAGLLAGLAAVVVLHLVLLLPKLPPPAKMAPWKKAQAWTWAIPAAWFLYGALQWWAGQSTHSVLAAGGSGTHFSNLITVFFGSACDLTETPITGVALRGCMPQFGYTSPLLGCIAYAAAAFVPMHWLRKQGAAESTASDRV